MPREDACLLGIDIGAGSLKSMVVAPDGRVLGAASRDLATRQPHPGWTEQDPADWWDAVRATVPAALAQAGVPADAVAAISFSAGAHTPVLTDDDGRPVRPAILWSDQRSGAESRELDEAHGAFIVETGANRPSPTWTLCQLRWLARHEPESLRAATRLYVAKDWLRSRLTGDWTTDVTDAVGTLLWDIRRNVWSETLVALSGFDPAKLPPAVRPDTVVGAVTAEAAAACGLRAGTPVVCGSSDTAVEAFGGGAAAPGAATVKLATAGTVSVIRDTVAPSRSVINYPYVTPGQWYSITGTNSCASAHRWLRDTLFQGWERDSRSAFAAMDEAAARSPAGSGGMIFHPYLNGERSPYWDPLLRADFIGVTMRHTAGDVVRALYEGIAFSLRDCMGGFAQEGLSIASARIIGGGAKSAVWRQTVADVLGVEILLPACTDASFGAALLAGVGTGVYRDAADAVARTVHVAARHAPDPANRALYDDLFGVYKEAQARLSGLNHELHAILARHGERQGERT